MCHKTKPNKTNKTMQNNIESQTKTIEAVAQQETHTGKDTFMDQTKSECTTQIHTGDDPSKVDLPARMELTSLASDLHADAVSLPVKALTDATIQTTAKSVHDIVANYTGSPDVNKGEIVVEESATAEETFSSSCSSLEIKEVSSVAVISDEIRANDNEPVTGNTEEESICEGKNEDGQMEPACDLSPVVREVVVVKESKTGEQPKEEPVTMDNDVAVTTDPETSGLPPIAIDDSISYNASCIVHSRQATEKRYDATENDQLEKGGNIDTVIPIDQPTELGDKAEPDGPVTEAIGEAIPVLTGQPSAPRDLTAVAIHLPSSTQVTFEPFESLTFTELKKISCMAKIKNVHLVFKRSCKLVNTCLPVAYYISLFMYLFLFIFIFWKAVGGNIGGLFQKLVTIAFTILAVKLIDLMLNIWYRVTMEPLTILVEAHDVMGETKNYIITDKRSRLAQAWNWGPGGQMEMIYAKNPGVALWQTEAKGAWADKILLKRSVDNAEIASYTLFSCCGEAQKDTVDWWKLVTCSDLKTWIKTPIKGGQVEFTQPIFGESNERNLLEPGYAIHQFSIKKSAVSCEDLMMETREMLDFGLVDVIGEEAACAYDAVNEAIDIKDDAKDALELLKENGYQKVQTSDAVWEVKFRPGMTEDVKAASVLYVIKQYAVHD